MLHLEDVTEKKTLTDNAVSEKAQQIQSVMDNLSDADQRRVLAFAQNLAMTMQGSESETKIGALVVYAAAMMASMCVVTAPARNKRLYI